MAGSDDSQRAHVSTLPPTQHEPGELPDHLPAHGQNPGPLAAVEILLHKLLHVGLLTFHTDVMGGINHLLLRLERIERAVIGDQNQDIEDQMILAAAPQRLDYQGRRHLLIWSASAVSGLVMRSHGSARTMALAAGWNVIDPPRNATLEYPGSSTVNLVTRATDHVAPSYA